jgi:hypothetical protein
MHWRVRILAHAFVIFPEMYDIRNGTGRKTRVDWQKGAAVRASRNDAAPLVPKFTLALCELPD